MKDLPRGLPLDTARAGCLLVGNGLNRAGGGHSWDDLLVSLWQLSAAGPADRGAGHGRGKAKVAPSYELDLQKPLPLLYEELLQRSPATGTKLDRAFLSEIQAHFAKPEPSALHEAVFTTGIRHILTTNYDRTLEAAGARHGLETMGGRGLVRETRYSLFRRSDVGTHVLWHIHGEVSSPDSIMLGYDHYAGCLQAIRQYVTGRSNYKDYKRGPLTGRLTRGLDAIDSWLDLFFATDVHIVGFGLPFEEMHLWWLLTWRARLIKGGLAVPGDVYYYQARRPGVQLPEEEVRKLQILDALGVKVVEVPLEKGDWKGHYGGVLELVRGAVRKRMHR